MNVTVGWNVTSMPKTIPYDNLNLVVDNSWESPRPILDCVRKASTTIKLNTTEHPSIISDVTQSPTKVKKRNAVLFLRPWAYGLPNLNKKPMIIDFKGKSASG